MNITNCCENLSKIDWLNVGVTFISVFLAALFAYKFSLKLEKLKFKRQMRGDFCSLVSQMWLNLDVMLEYKRNILDNIKIAYEKRKIEAISTIIRGPIVSFEFDMDKYIFLNDCNRCFISELKFVQSDYENLKFLCTKYTNRLSETRPQHLNGNQNVWEEMNKTFLFIYEIYSKFCIRLYYLNKHLADCYKRFFNINYYNIAEDEIEARNKIENYIPGALQDESFIKMSEYFDNYWAPIRTFYEDIKYYYRKSKYYFKWIKIYFLGCHKTKNQTKSKESK